MLDDMSARVGTDNAGYVLPTYRDAASPDPTLGDTEHARVDARGRAELSMRDHVVPRPRVLEPEQPSPKEQLVQWMAALALLLLLTVGTIGIAFSSLDALWAALRIGLVIYTVTAWAAAWRLLRS